MYEAPIKRTYEAPIKRTYENKLCGAWFVVIVILYAITAVFDIFPDVDTYIGGYGALGIWCISLTVIASALSIGYGSACIHNETVYRCIGFGECSKTKDKHNNHIQPLVWPSKEMKDSYESSYDYVLSHKSINKGITSYLPLSEYNILLKLLNDVFLYKNKKSKSSSLALKIAEIDNDTQYKEKPTPLKEIEWI